MDSFKKRSILNLKITVYETIEYLIHKFERTSDKSFVKKFENIFGK